MATKVFTVLTYVIQHSGEFKATSCEYATVKDALLDADLMIKMKATEAYKQWAACNGNLILWIKKSPLGCDISVDLDGRFFETIIRFE